MTINTNQAIRETLMRVYEVTYPHAGVDSFLPFDLGIIKLTTVNNPGIFKFRRKKSLGGLNFVRLPGTEIRQRRTGIDYIDQETGLYHFEDGETMNPALVLRSQNPDSLDPSDGYNLQLAIQHQMDSILVRTGNTARLFASLGLVPSITIDGHTYQNTAIEQVDYSSLWNWASTSTANPINNLFDLSENYFGTNKPAPGLTILMRSKQEVNLVKNSNVLQQLGFETKAGLSGVRVTDFGAVQRVFLQGSQPITLYVWNDGYRSSTNSDPYDNISYFLDPNYIVAIPNAYWVQTPGNIMSQTLVTPRSTTNPMVELLLAPQEEFMSKVGRLTGGLNIGAFTVPGAYFYSGYGNMYEPAKPDEYKTLMACSMGLFVEQFANIKYIKVQS